MRAAVVSAVAIAGCYAGGFTTMTAPFVGTRATVGCLDVAVALTEDRMASDTIIAYQFGNQCFHQTVVDFTALRVVGTTRDGQRVELAAYDPRHEIAPMQLDALTAGDERISYRSDAATSFDTICVDLGAFDRERVGSPTWKCLGAIGGSR